MTRREPHDLTPCSNNPAGSTKHYGGQGLTSLGFEQCFDVGGQYRARYLDSDSSHRIAGISEFEYDDSQIHASAPDQGILLGTATAFMQGLYPPLEDTNPDLGVTELSNGTETSNPLGGYQYVVLHGTSADAPDAIWIKGDDGCPAVAEAQSNFEDSDVFQERVDDTKAFYEKFEDVLADVPTYNSPSNFSYANAYDIFDLINVARIHNHSSAATDVSDDDLFQLRTLADSAQFGYNYDPEDPDRSIGAQTLIAGILDQLSETVESKAELKFSLFAGSYDTMLSFFGITGLSEISDNFTGLPDYASTLAFELFTDGDDDKFPDNTDDLRVRFLFKNGTSGDLSSYPLFGLDEETYSWPDFKDQMEKRDISSPGEWCGVCKSDQPFCAAYAEDGVSAKGIKGGMSGEMKGGIAMIVIGGVALVAGVIFAIIAARKLKRSSAAAGAGMGVGAGVGAEKGSAHSVSESSRV